MDIFTPSDEILRYSTKCRRSSAGGFKAQSNQAQDIELAIPDGGSDLRLEGRVEGTVQGWFEEEQFTYQHGGSRTRA